MAEYWKSTPKYWCKFCQTYVRDTKFERQQHEATGKHQGAIQRSLRDLHKNREREDREKQRAKDEVARLNGLTAGGGSSSSSAATAGRAAGAGGKKAPAPAQPSRQATAEERRRQLKQLAEMGVAVPDEFRREMAMAGEWQTVAVKALDPSSSAAEGSNSNNIDPVTGAPLNIGVRKRKAEGEEDEDGFGETGETRRAKKAGWGNSFKVYPGAARGDPGDDIEALLSGVKKPVVKAEEDAGVKKEEEDDGVKKEEGAADDAEGVKTDPAGEPKLADIPPVKEEGAEEEEKKDDAAPAAGVVFKKRKSKAMRTK